MNQPIIIDEESQYIYVYRDEISAWRKTLRIRDDQTMLVAFAWCSNKGLSLARMIPECMVYDTTFGVTSEQRSMFIIAAVDSHNKVFNATYFKYNQKKERIIIGQ